MRWLDNALMLLLTTELKRYCRMLFRLRPKNNKGRGLNSDFINARELDNKAVANRDGTVLFNEVQYSSMQFNVVQCSSMFEMTRATRVTKIATKNI